MQAVLSKGVLLQGLGPPTGLAVSVTYNSVPDNYTMEASATAPPGATVEYLWSIGSSPTTPTPVAAVTSFTPSTIRSNYTGQLGFRFTVGSSPIFVSALGRWCLSGNSQTHTVSIYAVSDNSLVASAVVDMAGAPAGAFKYTAITEVKLNAGAQYWIMSTETNGGDSWYNQTAAVAASGLSATLGSNYGAAPPFTEDGSGVYVPPGFLYATQANWSSATTYPGSPYSASLAARPQYVWITLQARSVRAAVYSPVVTLLKEVVDDHVLGSPTTTPFAIDYLDPAYWDNTNVLWSVTMDQTWEASYWERLYQFDNGTWQGSNQVTKSPGAPYSCRQMGKDSGTYGWMPMSAQLTGTATGDPRPGALEVTATSYTPDGALYRLAHSITGYVGAGTIVGWNVSISGDGTGGVDSGMTLPDVLTNQCYVPATGYYELSGYITSSYGPGPSSMFFSDTAPA